MSRVERLEMAHKLINRGVSHKRSSFISGIPKSKLFYKKKKDDEEVIKLIKELSVKHPRYGYRRIKVLLILKHLLKINHKKVRRIMALMGLTVKPRKKHRKIKTGNKVICSAKYPNNVWTYDFIFSSTENKNQIKFLTLVDEFTKECLMIYVNNSITSKTVINVLSEVIRVKGAPQFIRSDNGREFIAKSLKNYLKGKTEQLLSEPGKPWQNGVGEGFNSRFRDEFLEMNIFSTIKEAQIMTRMWVKEYNNERPHSSLNNQTPVEFIKNWQKNMEQYQ